MAKVVDRCKEEVGSGYSLFELREKLDRPGEEIIKPQPEMNAQRQYYKELFDFAPDAYFVIDCSGTIMDANRAAAEMLSAIPESLVGKPLGLFVVGEDYRSFLTQLRCQSILKPLEWEVRLRSKKRGTFTASAVMTDIRNTRGDRIGFRLSVRDATERKRMESAFRATEKHLRSVSFQRLKAQEEERKRMAGEVHDIFGASLTAIKYRIEDVMGRMDLGVATSGLLRSIIPMIQSAIQESHRMQWELRPPILDDFDIAAALSSICRRFETTHPRIRVEQNLELQKNDVPDPIKTAGYRVCQEALKNIVKHSGADAVRISLVRRETRIEMIIQDNGHGFDTGGCKRGVGLFSMKEHAELSGGTFSIESTPGKGSSIRIAWPIKRSPSTLDDHSPAEIRALTKTEGSRIFNERRL